MEKAFLLRISITMNFIIMMIIIGCVSFFHELDGYNSYFNIGWSEKFMFISININNPYKYFTLCSFVILMNVTEILMDNIAVPIIQFSTYNPYKSTIIDFNRNELEIYSNLLFFIQTTRRFVLIFITLSQIDIAIISWASSQTSAYFAIKYLLDNKYFSREFSYITVREPPIQINYNSIV